MMTPITHCALKKNGQKGFNDLSEEDQDKVKSVLFLLDKFCIGDVAYHELTMCSGGEDFPRSYLIKQCKDDLNKLCHITRTPGVAPGAQLAFATELESVLKKQVTAISLMKWNTKEIYIYFFQINQNKIDIDDPDLTVKNKNIWRWGKNDKTAKFYCNFIFCSQQ